MDLERLFLFREENDLTQEKMGAIVNTKKWSITKWENGKEIIPLPKLNIYANYFNTSMDYILKLTNKKGSTISCTTLDPKIVGQNIKKVRKDNNISQRELAKELGTTQSVIYGYENGKFLILTAFAYQICVKYNVSMDWLCGRGR
jgi:transcriptional regulator with XRE-family HTH domain